MLIPAAAHYFLKAKDKAGRPVDPVARFHLGNGARLERLNFLGDVSPNGLRQSHGLMVNYLYDLGQIEKNHEALAEKGRIAASDAVRAALPPAPAVLTLLSIPVNAMNANLFALLSDSIADPAATAIETAAGERISYADLVARTGRMANALAGLGVKPGDRVAAQVEKSVEAIVLYLGTVRAGGVFLPLNTGYTPAEIEYFVGDAEPAVFVCDPGRREALQAAADKAGATLVTLDAKGKGTPDGRGRRGAGSLRDGGARGRRPRGAALHLGHHRPLQGRDADPRQPRLERRGAARGLGATPPTTC